MELFISSVNNYDSALFFANQARKYSLTAGDSLTFVRAEYAMAYLYRGQGLYNEAIEHYDRALITAQNNDFQDREKSILNGLAICYYYSSQFDKSLEYHFKSLALREKEGDQNEIAISSNNIGLVYYQLKDYPKAIIYFNRAREIEEKNGHKGIEGTYVNLGLAYLGLGNFEIALENFEKTISICQDECKGQILFEAYNGAGACLFELEKLNEAEVYLNKGLVLAESQKSEMNLITIYNNLAKINLKHGETDLALTRLKMSQDLANRLGIRLWAKKNFKVLADLFYETGNYKKAFDYQVKYDSVSSEILNETVAKNMLQIQVDFEERQNLEIIKLKDKEISRTNTLLILSVIISLLTVLIVIILYRNNKLRKRVNRKLTIANKTIENQNSKLTELNTALEDRVRERTEELRSTNKALTKSNNDLDNFIYKTSHDIRGPLATLQGVCNIALMDIKEKVAVDYFEKLSRTASKLNQILSKLLVINQINNSMPSDDEVILKKLITEIVEENSQLFDEKTIGVSIDVSENLKIFFDALLLKIILNNLINNAFKFHNTSSKIKSIINISALVKDGELHINVSDNGVGINDNIVAQIFDIFSKTSEMQDTAGLGLYLVKLAVDKLEGNIFVSKTKDNLTLFSVILPLS
ncbi:MAG TPA: tetratricopeptide repeat protein [Fulvivirga sp.]|nr:tetratricopeptide repeat protein [Fulvivirga sp.]